MKNSNNSIKGFVFYLSYLLLLSFSVLGHITSLNPTLKIFSNISIVGFVVLIGPNSRYWYKKDFIILCFFIVVAFISGQKTSNFALIKIALIFLASRHIEIRQLIKFDLWVRMILVLMVLTLYGLGIATDTVAFFSPSLIKHSWGFQNSNHFGFMLTIMAMELLYLWGMKLTSNKFLTLIALMILTHFLTNSRSSEIVQGLTIMMSVLHTKVPKFYDLQIVRGIMKHSFIIFSLITYFSTLLYRRGGEGALILNQIFSGRLNSISYAAEMFPLTFLGSDIKVMARTLDNFYAYTLIGMGVIVFAIYWYTISHTIGQSFLNSEIVTAIIIFSFTVYGISERLWSNIDYNILLILCRNVLFRPNNYIIRESFV